MVAAVQAQPCRGYGNGAMGRGYSNSNHRLGQQHWQQLLLHSKDDKQARVERNKFKESTINQQQEH